LENSAGISFFEYGIVCVLVCDIWLKRHVLEKFFKHFWHDFSFFFVSFFDDFDTVFDD
jgi:hypothetical protein